MGDIVDSGMGYIGWRGGSVQLPYARVDYITNSGTKNLATGSAAQNSQNWRHYNQEYKLNDSWCKSSISHVKNLVALSLSASFMINCMMMDFRLHFDLSWK